MNIPAMTAMALLWVAGIAHAFWPEPVVVCQADWEWTTPTHIKTTE